jgi:hypothetical protein
VLVLVVVVGVGGAQGLHFRPSLSVILEIAGKKYMLKQESNTLKRLNQLHLYDQEHKQIMENLINKRILSSFELYSLRKLTLSNYLSLAQ